MGGFAAGLVISCPVLPPGCQTAAVLPWAATVGEAPCSTFTYAGAGMRLGIYRGDHDR